MDILLSKKKNMYTGLCKYLMPLGLLNINNSFMPVAIYQGIMLIKVKLWLNICNRFPQKALDITDIFSFYINKRNNWIYQLSGKKENGKV